MSLGLAALPAGASIIAEDAFNYIPLGFSLDGANGGGGSPGWTAPWSAGPATTVGTGLTYSGYGGLGLGNAATLGVTATSADVDPGPMISRTIGDSSSANTVWMRMLYSPGAHVEESLNTATPFQLATVNNNYPLKFQRTVGAGEGLGDEVFTLNMSGLTAASSLPFDFTGSGLGTYMLLFKLDINQATDGLDTLSMWLNPTSLTEGGLGATTSTVSLNILQGGDDYLAIFSADGYGDMIDELVIGTTFADAIGQLNDPVTSVPEVSGPVMMAMVGFLGGGVVWYRRRQKAVA